MKALISPKDIKSIDEDLEERRLEPNYPGLELGFDVLCKYGGTLGRTEYELIAREIIIASQEANNWTPVREFKDGYINDKEIHGMIDQGYLAETDVPRFTILGFGIGKRKAYLLSETAIDKIARVYGKNTENPN